MGLALTLDLKNGAAVAEALRATAGRARNLRAAGKSAGEELKLRHKRRLGAGIGVHGQPLRSQMSERFGSKPLGGSDGKFGNSLGWEVSENGLTFFSTWKGADVAQKGKTIRPTAGHKFLTIPLRARGGLFDLNSSGDRKISTNRTGRRARDYKDTFFRWVRRNLFLFQEMKSGKIRALFILLRSIKYPKNEWFGMNDGDQDALGKIYLDHALGKETK